MHAQDLPPGPPLPGILQSVGLLRFRHQFIPAMHRRYGDVFSIRILPEGRRLVVFNRPEHVKEIFAGDPEVFHAGKGNAILGPVMGEHSLLLVDGEQHKRARKLLMPAFNGHALRGYEGLVTGLAKAEVGRWREGDAVRVAAADERADPRGDPAGGLRRHRRDAARRAAAAGQQDREHPAADLPRLGLPEAAEVRPLAAHHREPGRAGPGDLRRDRRASPGHRPGRPVRRTLPAAAGARRLRRRRIRGAGAQRRGAARPARDAPARRPRDHRDGTGLGAARARQGSRRRRPRRATPLPPATPTTSRRC